MTKGDSMAISDVTEKKFEDQVLKTKLPVLVDFWAPWCGPCRMAEPVLEKLSDEYKDKVEFVKVNVDENQELAQKYQVMSIPTTMLMKDGEEIGRQIGFAGKQGFAELLRKVQE
jgi:thioredoxin 1